jgi:hypothetical protein
LKILFLKILEYCEAEQCIEREDYYLFLLKPEYNILSKAGSNLGFRHSEKSIKKKNVSYPEFGSFLRKVIKKIEELGTPAPKIEVFDQDTNLTTQFDFISAAVIALNVFNPVLRDIYSKRNPKTHSRKGIFLKG